jgi:1,4-alpha-glucan branching enzyme
MVTKTYFKTKDYCKVKFTVEAENATSVKVLGLNNDWNTPVVLSRKKTGEFATEVSLPKDSAHQFKYLVNDAEWIADPSADSLSPDSFGGSNSVISL